MAVMQLWEQGLVDLDASASDDLRSWSTLLTSTGCPAPAWP
jgi:hypothetical protein